MTLIDYSNTIIYIILKIYHRFTKKFIVSPVLIPWGICTEHFLPSGSTTSKYPDKQLSGQGTVNISSVVP